MAFSAGMDSAKDTINSAIEATEESLKGIGEGVRHGVTLVTGMGVMGAERAAGAGEDVLQQAARETPRATGKLHEEVVGMSQRADESIEDTKQKGIPKKIEEALQETKAELEAGFKPNIKELRKAKSDISLL